MPLRSALVQVNSRPNGGLGSLLVMRSFDDYPLIMKTSEVAEMLGIADVKQVREMTREGRLPAFREPGARRWLFDRDVLLGFLRSTRVNP